MSRRRVLIIEDDADAAGVLDAYLKRENYDVAVCGDGLAGLERSRSWKPDLILLDVMLPSMNGTEILAAVRRSGQTPVIMITAMGDLPDKVGALRYGADDYIVKPYDPREVVARVQAVLRRAQSSNGGLDEVLRWQGLEVDTSAMTVTIAREGRRPEVIELTPTEFSLLRTMMHSPVRAWSRQALLDHCLPDSDALDRVVDTHIYNLRKKLETAGIDDVLLNVRGVGYRFRQP